ncbi:MAG: hypothetical protein AB8G96_09815 [Phycisphaerales bacterium]
MAIDPPFDPACGNHWLMMASPQATTELRNDHFNAMLCPQGLEVPPVEMLRGWLAAADAWGRCTGGAIGSVSEPMYREWKRAGESLRRMLDAYGEMVSEAEIRGHAPCRLNFATLDRMIVAAMEWQDLETERDLDRTPLT